MSLSKLGVLRDYVKLDPTSLPASVLFSHTNTSMTIYDAFPKSIFHFLILPRLPATTVSTSDLDSLRSILNASDKEAARAVIQGLKRDADVLRREIEEEMIKRYGFTWKIWTGFHALLSMLHLHLHVLSSDLCSPTMKNKKHYNSFHPKHGFFLHIDDVLEWFDAVPSYFSKIAQLPEKQYEPILKERLACWKCGADMKNMPTLKQHLQADWDAEAKRVRPTTSEEIEDKVVA